MDVKDELRREGDLNLGHLRQIWLKSVDDKTRTVLDADAAVFMKQSMSTPCMNEIVDAQGCYITDGMGRTYLDFHGNSLHQVGYKNPYVMEAVINQLEKLPFIPRRYTSQIAIDAAQILVNKTSSKNFRVLFSPSGSVAVGIALKIARKVTGWHKVISMWESFHGAGLDTISASGEYAFTKDMGPLLTGCIHSVPYNAYRNLINSNCPETTATFCLDYLEYIIRCQGDIGAILMEPIRATDTHVPPHSYFKRLRELCTHYGILLVFDEIPTALGRSGEFYVHQKFGIEPDILVLGKGLGGGTIPVAAVLAKTELDVAQDISLGHYTHEKPALGSAALLATIRYLDDRDLLANCRQQSLFALQRAYQLMEKYDCIGDVRIAGLLITFELVKNRASKEKDDNRAELIFYHCLTNGLSFKLAAGNCITWHPPLIVTQEQLTVAFSLLENAIQATK